MSFETVHIIDNQMIAILDQPTTKEELATLLLFEWQNTTYDIIFQSLEEVGEKRIALFTIQSARNNQAEIIPVESLPEKKFAYLIDAEIDKHLLKMVLFDKDIDYTALFLQSESGNTITLPPEEVIRKKHFTQVIFSLENMYAQINLVGEWSFLFYDNQRNFCHIKSVIKRRKHQFLITLPKLGNKQAALEVSRTHIVRLIIQPRVKLNHLRVKNEARVIDISSEGTKLTFVVKIPRKYREKYSFRLILQQRRSFLDSIKISNNRRNRHHVEFTLDVMSYQNSWAYYYWDLYLECQSIEDEELIYDCRLINKSALLYRKLQYHNERYQWRFDRDILYPYQTLGQGISLNFRPVGEFETVQVKKNEKNALLYARTIGWFVPKKKRWIIHEKFANSAQDNSFFFFKYLIDHTDIDARFVIRWDSPQRERLKGYESYCLDFMSFQHLSFLLTSSKIISSESKGHGYAWRVQTGPIKARIDALPYVFLQHGVLGLKRLDKTFDAGRVNHADLFITSAEWEKQIVCENMHYSDENVAITGLPRWDAVEITAEEKRDSILVMPTWRQWLEDLSDDEFVQSEFFLRYQALIHNSQLWEYLAKSQHRLILYVHPKLSEYVSLFHGSFPNEIEIIPIGSQPLDEILSASICVVTDYSSIYWEALYRGIPTVFYQFDRERYLLTQGSYLNLNSVPAIFCQEEGQLINALVSQEYAKLDLDNEIKNYFMYHDHSNSERVYQEIMRRPSKGSERLQRRITHSQVYQMYQKRWRDLKKAVKRILH